MVPNLTATFIGCRFAPRCPFAEDRCRSETQTLRGLSGKRLSRCWKAPLTELVA
jgi:oligopeptide/dipeptide ABC transporter ATP-binding protein